MLNSLQDCLVLSESVVWTELATSQDCWRQKISKLFCPVSKCDVNRVLFCLDPVSNLQPGLVCKRVHTADRTGQNCLVSNVLRTIENCRRLLPTLFTPRTRQDKTVLPCPCRCKLGIIVRCYYTTGPAVHRLDLLLATSEIIKISRLSSSNDTATSV